ncbi:MAG: transcription antitermination factor NusB [Cyclobacteriaceae bacterium]|nr:transcription antitermination factor NusB [Cyclobacteriaceae bacterium]
MRPSFLPFLAMLNRRTLRIKIMQSIFAYEQCKEADYELAIDHIEEFFQPDLNSMKIQDKELLKGQRAVAIKEFEKRFKGQAVKENPDPRIAQAVEEALSLEAAYLKKDFDYFRKNSISDVEKINTFYFAVLNLIPALATVAATDKKVSAKNLISNPIVEALRDHAQLKRETLRAGSNWDERMELVRGWFRDCVRGDKEFQQYCESLSPTLETHHAFVKHLIRKIILGPTLINSHFEEWDLRWSEDHDIVKSLAEKTLKSFDEKTKAIEIQKLSLEWDDDKDFIERLFSGAVRLDPRYHELIASNTKNWEVDRLPLTDRVILQMAIAEMITFQNIPVKVTINEYIELAKHYSTPKSRQFINGILDVIAKELVKEGKIKKSGRGLLDNR